MLQVKDFTVEQLAKILGRGPSRADLRDHQGERRWTKRYLRHHGGEGSGGELDALLVGIAVHPDFAEIERLAAELPSLPPRQHPEPPIDPWLRCARIVCEDQVGRVDSLPGGLDDCDVPSEWREEARAWPYEPSPEMVAHWAKKIAAGETDITPGTTDYRELCELAYGERVASSWMAEQTRRQEALTAADDVAYHLWGMVKDVGELQRMLEDDEVFVIHASTSDDELAKAEDAGREIVEADEWARLHEVRGRLDFLRSFRKLVLTAAKYEPADERVKEFLKG